MADVDRNQLAYQQALRYAEELRELYEKERHRTAELEAAQEQLRQAEAKYRALVERLPAIVYDADFGQAGTWRYVSPQIEPILGFTPEEWMADPLLWYRQIHPDDREVAIEAEARSRATGEPLLCEYRMLTRDGRVVWFRDEAAVLAGPDGRSQSLQGVMYDVTVRKRDEAAIHRYTQRLESLRQIDRAILSADSPEALVGVALSRLRELIPCERATVSLVDAGVGELVPFMRSPAGEAASPPTGRVPLDALGALGPGATERLRRGEALTVDDLDALPELPPALAAIRSEGVRSVLAAPLLSDGDLVGILALVGNRPAALSTEHRDIAAEVANQLAIAIRQSRLLESLKQQLDERIRAEEGLRASEARKSAILEAAMDCIITMDHEGNVAEFNPAAEATFGYTREQVVGRKMGDLIIPPSLRHAHREGLARYLATGEGAILGKRLELTGMRADGTEFPVEVAITRVQTPGPPLFTGYLRDISDRKRADQELQRTLQRLRVTDEQRQRLLSRLVNAHEEERSRIAGDIHDDSIQVMTAVGMRLDVLGRDLSDHRQRALLEELEDTVNKAIARLRTLLFELRPPALDREGLGAALRLHLEQLREEHGVTYRLENRLRTEPRTETRVLLYRIAQEALTNVRKHARAERVEVVAEDRDGGYLMRVTDDGVGFTVEGEDPYHPGHLGLVALRERAEMAGGWCRVDSAPRAGTTVEVWVPGHDGGPGVGGRPEAPVADPWGDGALRGDRDEEVAS